ncbi:GNAT family N-acetyltransferase [Herbidospora galbida]|uniref:GNAT family N-acetyltransferase n=1 Tax=Herbidospora galbida TaxID=2575442 RepID=A0A4U3MCN1_9ACTN|nr:GNAT family protein [Herbidospora galbida]TKK86149.1 GNAT family N-acetyltransferase [Herbidospora galbida]
MIDVRGTDVRLRSLRPADLKVYTQVYTSAVLTRYLGVDRMDEDRARATFLAGLRSDRRITLAITEPDDEAVHGLIGLLLEDYGSNAMITGLVLLPGSPIQGRGAQAGRLLIEYAFAHLGIHRIWACHRHDQPLMERIMLDAGLRPEATLRQLFRTQGRWHDVTTYAALSHEWDLVYAP